MNLYHFYLPFFIMALTMKTEKQLSRSGMSYLSNLIVWVLKTPVFRAGL